MVTLLTARRLCLVFLSTRVSTTIGMLYMAGVVVTAYLLHRFSHVTWFDFWLVILFGLLIGAALAAVFGLLAIRASGVYFLMITLALGQCVWGLAYRWNSLTNG